MEKILSSIKFHKWFFVSLVLVVFLAFFRFNKGIVQQDNYVGYAESLPNLVSSVSFYESRLFPGLPLLIYTFSFLTKNLYLSGYIITILSFVGSYFLLYKLTRSKLSFLPLIFPPILLNLASLIATEYPFIFLILLSYFLIKKEKLALAFLVLGVSVWFRLSGIAAMAGVFIFFLISRKFKGFLLNLPYFLIPILILVLFNVYFFGIQNPFYQLFAYEALHPDRISVGVIQLLTDLIRSFRWHWYGIFFSGLFYITFFVVAWIKSVKFKGLEFWIITAVFFFTLVVNLVPFLENLGRYLAPTVPFFWLIFHNKFKSQKWVYLLLPISLLIVLI